VALVAAGRVKTVVDRTLPLERFEEGFAAIREGRLVGRAVLVP
jgi:NADPH:quinone reductase-like Zn-dependent oxidoreductase